MDSVWLPIPFLKDLVKYGEIYGIGMSFTELLNREERDKLLFENQDTLKLDIRRLYVKEMLQALTHSELRMAAGLNKISILNYSDEDSDNYIIDDITYAGKITGRGTSFSKHLFLTHNVLEEYENSVNLIEDNFSFNYDLDSYKISGAPITINLNRKNINIYKLVETLFSGKKPFQLWGIPDWRSENYCYVSAVDLHLGNFGKQIHFEITSSTIKVILPKSSCGNSVARLITNIHQSIDATSSIKGGKIMTYSQYNELDLINILVCMCLEEELDGIENVFTKHGYNLISIDRNIDTSVGTIKYDLIISNKLKEYSLGFELKGNKASNLETDQLEKYKNVVVVNL